ncbi:PDZ domain-containing protein [Gallaecimonas sp. GXIMD4217]|uniref:S41 family peptidase n=1 Tax=Gallaecimonas sp. GXIMD4217 TaxID=3131927 RepID=UPI00311AED70
MKKTTLALAALALATGSGLLWSKGQQPATPAEAWQAFSTLLKEEYAYQERADLDALLARFAPKAQAAKDEQELVDLMQQLTKHFQDPHLNVGPYDERDYSVMPTGSDIWARAEQGRFVVEDVKGGSAALEAGIRPGDQILAVDGVPAAQAAAAVFGRKPDELAPSQLLYGLNVALGGRRNQGRTLVIERNGAKLSHELAASYQAINQFRDGAPLSYKRHGKLGHIRFNNSLGRDDTAAAFSAALAELADTDALLLDLRNTPSGGNTGVAEPILGHFVTERRPYQAYRVQEPGLPYHKAPLRQAFVQPSQPYYGKPVVVLAGRWTGSMGEGMTIGMEALGAEVFGAPMADLLGGIKSVILDGTRIRVELGFERIYHVDGRFREDYQPPHLSIPADTDAEGEDPALKAALAHLSRTVAR